MLLAQFFLQPQLVPQREQGLCELKDQVAEI